MKWSDIGDIPVKGERMKMSEANFDRITAMRDELILEQKDEISKLKMTVNKLRQKINRGKENGST